LSWIVPAYHLLRGAARLAGQLQNRSLTTREQAEAEAYWRAYAAECQRKEEARQARVKAHWFKAGACWLIARILRPLLYGCAFFGPAAGILVASYWRDLTYFLYCIPAAPVLAIVVWFLGLYLRSVEGCALGQSGAELKYFRSCVG
jgi:hypothetical protein